MNRVTIKDVAERSGISIRTVSRVINDDPNVKKETRIKVQAIIDELGFKVNMVARSLKEMKTNQIVIFIDRRKGMYWGAFHNEILHELHRSMKSRGYRMVISASSPDSFEEDENDGFYLVKHGLCDGAVIFDPNIGDKRITYLKEKAIPFVIIGKDKSNFETSYVDLDNKYAGYLGAKYIYDQGWENFAFLLGSEKSVTNQERAKGFQQYCEEHHLQNPIIFGLTDLESAHRETAKLLADRKRKAIFISGDERALGVYRAIMEQGLKVGKDIGVIGIDNLRMGEFLFPALTTIGQPKQEISELALDILVDQIHSSKTLAKRMLISPSIVERESMKS
ncbi:LacI family transcriptional regulator [Paenibacillus sp. MZ04-78.2]|uniref:LacI family DNA-binding transcriptional regulator n=1 Tax=Paenibacillus sp. MZ04-78.2 TaxID=2962034 RepID=UPI0020B7752A|nr:LacI family DNA-binding transcriptional regulator [Paenibacillus sp. MZ04-78.2]MCP3776635.1 LacI family transcriptional regulator [Paenibacillus sp. MZ04-78.2]